MAWMPSKNDRKRVAHLVGQGWTQQAVALEMGVSAKTLSKHCAEAIAEGKAKNEVALLGRMHQLALQQTDLKTAHTSTKWLLSSQHGHHETTKLQGVIDATDQTLEDEVAEADNWFDLKIAQFESAGIAPVIEGTPLRQEPAPAVVLSGPEPEPENPDEALLDDLAERIDAAVAADQNSVLSENEPDADDQPAAELSASPAEPDPVLCEPEQTDEELLAALVEDHEPEPEPANLAALPEPEPNPVSHNLGDTPAPSDALARARALLNATAGR